MAAHTCKIKIINRSRHPLPAYQSLQAAGMDLRACIDQSITLGSLERASVPTGIYMALPNGHEGQVRGRSGLAKKGIVITNGIGTIDADYRGELQVPLINLSREPFVIEDGARIAQLIVAKHEKVAWEETNELSETKRGTGGFGSTGRR
ncbi:MAG: dUTP diphosphatase [Cytophagales bacterium]